MNKKLLIVDDNPELREALKDMLEDEGYNVDLAEDGDVALDKTKKQDYDVICMDMVMPKKSGLETIKEIRKFNKAVSIFILTAFDVFDEVKPEAEKENIYCIMTKPFQNAEIVKVVKEGVKKKEKIKK